MFAIRWFAILITLSGSAFGATHLIHVTTAPACLNNSVGSTPCVVSAERWDYADADYIGADLCEGTCKYEGEGAFTKLTDPRSKAWMCLVDIEPGTYAGRCPVMAYTDKTQAARKPATTPPTFTLREASCYFGALAHREQYFRLPGAIVWWCDTPSGVERNHFTWSKWESSAPTLPPNATDGDVRALQRAATTRISTPEELSLVNALSDRWGPRCFTIVSGTATTVPIYSRNADGTRGPQRRDSQARPMAIAPGMKSDCRERLLTTTRYSWVSGLMSTSGEAIPLDSYARTNLQLAPAAGW